MTAMTKGKMRAGWRELASQRLENLFFFFLFFFVVVVVVVIVVVVAISWAAPAAYGGSQARG